MTYAILKEGVFHLFEACEQPTENIDFDSWEDHVSDSVMSAIEAEDQDMVKKILGDKVIDHGSDSYIGTYESIFYPLQGYRIEVIDLCRCERHPGMLCFMCSGKFKTAKLIKE